MPSLLKQKFCKGKDAKQYVKEMREKILKRREDKLAEWHKAYAGCIMTACARVIENVSAGQEDEFHENPNRMKFDSTDTSACKNEFGDEVAKGMAQSVAKDVGDTLVSMGFRTVKVEVVEYTFDFFVISTCVLE